MEHSYYLGKCDYNHSGRRNCEAYITWRLESGRFSMSAEIWNPKKTDIYIGGQCVDTVAAFFPNDKKAQRMVAIWREWHLNDMTAGSPAQEAFLREHDHIHDYKTASAMLAEAGINPDSDYLYNGEPYKYGHAWLMRDLPDEIVAEIKSWEV